MPEHVVELGILRPSGYPWTMLSSRVHHSIPDCHRSRFASLRWCRPLALYASHVAALTASTSTTPHRSDRLLLSHDPVPLGLARRPPSQHGQTSPPRVSRTWSCQPSRVGPPGAVSSAVCVCPPPMGSPWPAAWAHRVRPCPQPVDSQTVRASQHSRSQQLHHLCTPCLYHLGCTTWG